MEQTEKFEKPLKGTYQEYNDRTNIPIQKMYDRPSTRGHSGNDQCLSQLKEQHLDLQRKIVQKQNDLSGKQESLAALEVTIENHEQHIPILERKIDQLQTGKQAMELEIRALNLPVNDGQDSSLQPLQPVNDRIKTLQTEVREKTSLATSLKRTCKAIYDQKSFNAKIVRCRSFIESMKNEGIEVTNLETTISRLDNLNETLDQEKRWKDSEPQKNELDAIKRTKEVTQRIINFMNKFRADASPTVPSLENIASMRAALQESERQLKLSADTSRDKPCITLVRKVYEKARLFFPLLLEFRKELDKNNQLVRERKHSQQEIEQLKTNAEAKRDACVPKNQEFLAAFNALVSYPETRAEEGRQIASQKQEWIQQVNEQLNSDDQEQHRLTDGGVSKASLSRVTDKLISRENIISQINEHFSRLLKPNNEELGQLEKIRNTYLQIESNLQFKVKEKDDLVAKIDYYRDINIKGTSDDIQSVKADLEKLEEKAEMVQKKYSLRDTLKTKEKDSIDLESAINSDSQSREELEETLRDKIYKFLDLRGQKEIAEEELNKLDEKMTNNIMGETNLTEIELNSWKHTIENQPDGLVTAERDLQESNALIQSLQDLQSSSRLKDFETLGIRSFQSQLSHSIDTAQKNKKIKESILEKIRYENLKKCINDLKGQWEPLVNEIKKEEEDWKNINSQIKQKKEDLQNLNSQIEQYRQDLQKLESQKGPTDLMVDNAMDSIDQMIRKRRSSEV